MIFQSLFIGQLCLEVEHLTHVIGHIWPLDNGYCLLDTNCRSNGDTENLLLLWNVHSGEQIVQLRSYHPHEAVEVIRLNALQFLTYTQDSEHFQIWEGDNGSLLATGDKQSGRPLSVDKNVSTVMIKAVHDPDIADQSCLLNIRTWLWDGTVLTLEKNVNLVDDTDMELDLFDQSACICDSQLFEDGHVLLPSPMSLWSGETGEKIADLQGCWSLGISIFDFGSFFRRFEDGRLLTWSEQRWGHGNLANRLYLWNKKGTLIRELVIDSLFSDVRILDQHLFVTFNCDDTLQVWDATNGDLRQTIIGLGAKIDFAVLLANGQLLIRDLAKQLSLWTLASATPKSEHRHTSNTHIQAMLIKDRILSYSLDTFPLRLWDANSGEWISTLPAYDTAVGAYLKGVTPLSGGRFLTWGHAPVIHMYDSQQGQCLASLQSLEKPHIGQSTVWSLQQDRIVCLLWDQSLRIYDLQGNHFDTSQVIAHQVKNAYPVGTDRVLYWLTNGVLKLWNVANPHHDFDLLGHFENIEKVLNISHHRVLVLAKNQQPLVIDWKSGKWLTLGWTETPGVTHLTEITNDRIVLWSSKLLQIFDFDSSPSPRLALSFEVRDYFVFVAQLPNGDLITQVNNDRATIWQIWDVNSGELLGATILPLKSGNCVETKIVDQTMFLRLDNTSSRTDFYVMLDWQDPDNLQFMSLCDIKSSKDKLALKRFVEQSGLNKGDWYFWSTLTGKPIGLSRLGEAVIRCEWHGEPLGQFLGLTDDGKVLGFGRTPILLQLYNGNQPAKFKG